MMYQRVEEKTEVVSINVSLPETKLKILKNFLPGEGGWGLLFCGFLLFAGTLELNSTSSVG
jgi:hypothetical protein